jgi:hypothetical protein
MVMGLNHSLLGANSGVVHGRGFDSLTFLVSGGVAMHGRGFESLIFGSQ